MTAEEKLADLEERIQEVRELCEPEDLRELGGYMRAMAVAVNDFRAEVLDILDGES